jgi:hypothetical protein
VTTIDPKGHLLARLGVHARAPGKAGDPRVEQTSAFQKAGDPLTERIASLPGGG